MNGHKGKDGKAGSPGLVWAGEWTPEGDYRAIRDGQVSRDVVMYNGSAYVVAVNNPAPVMGIVPEGDTTGRWELLVSKGEDGEKGEGGVFSGNTESTTPTEAAREIIQNKNVRISHADESYGVIVFSNFTYAMNAGLIIASVIFESEGEMTNASLVGVIATNTWEFSAKPLEAGENPVTLDRILGIERDLLEIEGKLIDGWRIDSKGFLYLLAGENVAVGPIGPFSGGGGGSATGTYTITLTNLLADRILTVPEGKEVLIKFNYSSEDSDGFKDGNGIGQVLVEGNVKKTFTAKQGDNEVDIGPYLVSGANNVSIKVTNSENISKQLPYTVTVAALKLTSTFDAMEIRTGAFQFPYTPTGIAEKTVHIELDGTELEPVVITTSGREQKYPIPAQSHGAHVIKAWFTSMIGEDEVPSNELYYSFISTVAGNNAPIIAISRPHATKAEQYENIATKYRVYNPKSLTALISLEADGEVLKEITVDRTEQT
jgi:hypothetical protein